MRKSKAMRCLSAGPYVIFAFTLVLVAASAGAQQILLVSPALPTSADEIRVAAERPGCDYSYSTAVTGTVITLTANKSTEGCPPPAPPDPFLVVEFFVAPLPVGSYTVVMITNGKVTDSRTFVVQAPSTSLSLLQGRFAVSVIWTNPLSGATVSARADQLGDMSGYFWFFNAENVDLTVKMLGPDPFSLHYWLFVSSGTNLSLTITVTDTWLGRSVTYHNAAGLNRNILDFTSFTYLPPP